MNSKLGRQHINARFIKRFISFFQKFKILKNTRILTIRKHIYLHNLFPLKDMERYLKFVTYSYIP